MMISDKHTLTTVSVSNRPHYTSNFTLRGRPFNIRCGYNTRNKKRWIILTDKSDRPILTQTFMSDGKQCQLNHIANRYDLSFMVTLKKKDRYKFIPEDYDYLNWADDFELYFVGTSQSLQERLWVNGREAYVGG